MGFQGYDISFLITNYHCEDMQKNKLIDFIVQFMEVNSSIDFLSRVLVLCVPNQLLLTRQIDNIRSDNDY